MKKKLLYKNPVAKLFYRKRLHEFAIDAKIKVYLLEDGDDATGFLEAVDRFLAGVAIASELSGVNESDARLRVLRGGLSAIRAINCTWDKSKAVAIEMAVTNAINLLPDIDLTTLVEVFEVIQWKYQNS